LWGGFGSAKVTLAASVAVAVDLTAPLLIAVPSLNNYTLVRVRALCGVQNIATNNATFYNLAMTVGNRRAFAAGGFADPEDDDASWLWQQSVTWSPFNIREIAAGTFNEQFQMVEIDTKAKRRFDETEKRLLFVIKNRQAIASEFFIEGQYLLELR